VARYGWRVLLVLGLSTVCFTSRASGAAEHKGVKPSELVKRLAAVEEAQRSLAADIAQLRDQLGDIGQRIGEVGDALQQSRDAAQADRDQLKEMREEVRGLYVESNGLKGDIAQVRGDLQTVNDSFSNFRFSSGALIAVLIVLEVIAVALTLRGRA
jgi:chromosome segregation ATPase